MNDIKVSIIIPVYNGAEFIRRSFDSCVYQTLKDIEIIAVNDCSPNPRDAEIMLEYEQQYPGKFRAMFHDTNKRQGGARNTGIRVARGDYFICVDQDDYIELDMCEKMYAEAVATGSNICMCGYKVFNTGCIIEYPPVLCSQESFGIYVPNVWRLLVRKQFVEQNEAYFPENVVTDDVISILWFMLTSNVCVKTACFYNWMRHKSAESVIIPYRYCSSIPISFIEICQYKAFVNLPVNKKKEFSLMATHCLHGAVLDCAQYHPEKMSELSKLIRDALNLLTPDFSNTHFRSSYGKQVAARLTYVFEHYLNKDIISGFKMLNVILSKESFNSKKLEAYGVDANFTIYGAGTRGKRLAEHLSNCNVKFEITDSNPKLYGEKICGRNVKQWEELKRRTDVVIVSPLNAFLEVKELINDSSIVVIDFKELLKP